MGWYFVIKIERKVLMKNSRLFKTLVVLVLCITMVLISIPVSAATNSDSKWLTYKELIKQKGFVSGIQQGWFISGSTGNDWGHSILDGYTVCNYNEEMFMKVFYNSKAMGFDIFKTWLNYNHAGMIFDSEYNVIGIDEAYLENLPKVLQMAQDAGLYVCLSTFNHCEGSLTDDNSSFKYEAVTKYLHNDAAREMVFENWLRPIIEVTKDFPNVVLIDLYTEPEADGGKWDTGNSANWEEMRNFIKLQNEFIKEINPRLETYSSATVPPEEIYKNYQGLGLDYYAYDNYTNAGGAHETSELFLDAPFIYGECGMNVGTGLSGEEYASNWLSNYFAEAPEYGVKGGFFWRYGYGSSNHNAIDKNGRPRSAMVTSRFWQLDRDYALAGIEVELDKPAMCYTTNENIVWMGSRGAQKYRVERTTDLKTWSKILEFNPEENPEYEYAPMMFDVKDDTAKAGMGINYYYRVVAIDADGKEAVSDPSNIVITKKVYCSEEENLIKNYSFEDENGFNDTGKDGKWFKMGQSGVSEKYSMKYITDAVEGDKAHTGTHSMHKSRKLYQYVTLEPNTNYTFTFHVKFDNKDGLWNWFGGLLYGTPDGNEYEAFEPAYNVFFSRIQPDNSLKNGEWQRLTYFFNSGNYTEIKVEIQSYHTSSDNPDWYVDDFYLFKTDEQ